VFGIGRLGVRERTGDKVGFTQPSIIIGRHKFLGINVKPLRVPSHARLLIFCMKIHTRLHIGTSGWSYPWQEIFYPPDLRPAGYLQYYATRFDCTVYLRLHGEEKLYDSNYSEEHLEKYAFMIKDWLEDGKEVWMFFNNTMRGQAIADSEKLRGMLGKILWDYSNNANTEHMLTR
jgi:hypothetical protein